MGDKERRERVGVWWWGRRRRRKKREDSFYEHPLNIISLLIRINDSRRLNMAFARPIPLQMVKSQRLQTTCQINSNSNDDKPTGSCSLNDNTALECKFK